MATQQVMISMKDAPFSFGPWGETFSILSWLFLDSTVDLLAVPDCGLVPAVHEATIALDWSLPMTAESQTYLFTRVRMQFEKSTAIIENPADRRRYRLCEDDLMGLRNLMCLWSQIRAFCSTRLGTFSDFDQAITSGNSKDHELREILDQKPPRFSLSMLPCAQKHALEEVRAAEEGATLEAETERLKVREARWQWFQAALARDQVLLRQVVAAPEKIQAMKHRKQMSWRLVQAKNGEKVVRSYMDKFLHCEIVAKVELAQQKINEYRSFVAS